MAFTAQELEMLQTHKEFDRALHECRGSREETQRLIALGGALLAEQSRAKSRFRRPDPDS